MNYISQLSLIVSFIGLRLLTMVLYVFFQPATPGIYTPYILFLYTLFDVLIICYLYRFVKLIKQQPFSLIALVLIVLAAVYNVLLSLFSSFETESWTLMQIQLFTMPPILVTAVAKIILAVQLIQNKATDHSRKHLIRLGWSYVLLLFIGIVFPFANALVEFFPNSTSYVLHLSTALPLLAMLVLYISEIKKLSDSEPYTGGPMVDSEV